MTYNYEGLWRCYSYSKGWIKCSLNNQIYSVLLASENTYGLLSISSTNLAAEPSDPPNTPIVVLRTKEELFLLIKGKSEIISTERLARCDAEYMPSTDKIILFSV